MISQKQLKIATHGRGLYRVDDQIKHMVRDSGIRIGICHVFVQHTSASLLICENADPQVGRDLEAFLARLVPDGDPLFGHADEGPDDMPAHIRSVLTNMDLSLPIVEGRCGLGTWQGVFLYEHRAHAHQRRLCVTLTGQ
ncbi:MULTISPECIES: secondary thiamine-phosphate synthase enzyme YjbQ [Thiorhodovibrio]|uniref:secondary thiamine-phosphate synthase enzyme YjbQ n=1 Tax=Thiorhodovibrio TaxID=61593 RepID=UPI0019120CBE|nr:MULTISPECIES: secondary thiamine-phosphate synthase enzyme YjbQ [Thiorhodovibrio]MBK5968555.1 secondary thiamine-phosphate synthase [Thiorhodovibrio winogradskyi]WPL11348.1 secondary thiamine-phosphate synthase enzyme [Thiorhodovibrio litoralis]